MWYIAINDDKTHYIKKWKKETGLELHGVH